MNSVHTSSDALHMFYVDTLTYPCLQCLASIYLWKRPQKKNQEFSAYLCLLTHRTVLSRVQLRATGDMPQATRDITYHLSRDKK